ncbi:MAG: MlaD family protein, partial [Muribaculaceae bacterium]|nr:MlaD family protein [Muribaculaceae bacterium]
MKPLQRKEFIIGLLVIVALAILFAGINFLKGINIFKASNYYYIGYNDVAGLAVSAPVNLNGYKVGQVRAIHYDYDHPGQVFVEISVDKSLRLPHGTQGELATDILGTATVALKLSN